MKPFDSDHFKDEDDRNDFFIAIPVIALAGIFVLFQMMRGPESEQNEALSMTYASIETTETESLWSTEEQEEMAINEEPLLVAPRKIQRAPIKPLKIGRSKINTKQPPAVSPPIIGAEDIEIEAVKIEVERSAENEVVEETKEDESTSPTAPVIEEKQEIEKPTVPEAHETRAALDCSIAVGLYVEDKNTAKMLGRLKTAGYKAITVPMRRSTKVAIKIPCAADQAQQILKDIRANYASDAFIE